jgi:threonine/homoserine/homoserine lactone efflux protein
MTECIITISIVGILAGFLFSVPIAGPISILVTSNALKGKLRYCQRAAVGAALGEVFYVFIAVYGITLLYKFYQPYIPYILLVGAVFLLLIGIKIIKTDFDFNQIDDSNIVKDKLKNKGGFRTGFILVVTNPSLIAGWMTSSFMVLSFISSIGLNTGGLDLLISKNVNSMSNITAAQTDATEQPSKLPSKIKPGSISIPSGSQNSPDIKGTKKQPERPMLLSSIYSVAIAFGVFLWFYNFAKFLVKRRKRLNLKTINIVVRLLGALLCGISVYLAYSGLSMIL